MNLFLGEVLLDCLNSFVMVILVVIMIYLFVGVGMVVVKEK